jgi:hypothetical protein
MRISDPSLGTGYVFTKSKGDPSETVQPAIVIDKTGFDATPNANYFQIDKNGKDLEFKIYRASQAIVDLVLTIPNYDQTEKLYPFYIIKGEFDATRLGRVKYTLDPYETNLSRYTGISQDESEYSELGATPTRIVNSRKTIKSFEFQNISIANFLGFTQRVLANQSPNTAQFYNVATNQYKILVENPYYVVRMDSMDLESYDGNKQTGQRFNILATFGNDAENESRSYFYEASNPIFLDLKNQTKRSIRNIRLSILNSDLTPINSDGLCSMSLIVKDK